MGRLRRRATIARKGIVQILETACDYDLTGEDWAALESDAKAIVQALRRVDLDAVFLTDSYGYRPRKSALDAVGVTRERCWKYDWVLEFDIKGLFDNIDHMLLLPAVRKHVAYKWALLYIERWLTAPTMQEDGSIIARNRGTPQGGVVSPIL